MSFSAMMRKRSFVLLLVLLMTVSAALTGCSGASAPGTQQPPEETASVPTETETEPATADVGEFASESDRERYEALYGLELPFEIGVFRLEAEGVCFLDGRQLSWRPDGRKISVRDGDTALYTFEPYGFYPGDDSTTAVKLTAADDPEKVYKFNGVRTLVLARQGPADIPERFVGTWGFYKADNDIPPITEELTITEDGFLSYNGSSYSLVENEDISVSGGEGVLLFQGVYSSPEDPRIHILESTQQEDLLGFCLDDGSVNIQYFVKGLKKAELTPENWQDYFTFGMDFSLRRNDSGEIESVSSYYALVPRDGIRIWRIDDGFAGWVIHPSAYGIVEFDLTTEEYTLREATPEEVLDLSMPADVRAHASDEWLYNAMLSGLKQRKYTDKGTLRPEGIPSTMGGTRQFTVSGNTLTCLVEIKMVAEDPQDMIIRGTIYYQEQ